MCKWQPSLPARFMCTKKSVFSPHDRRNGNGNSAHGGAKRSKIRHLDGGPWDVGGGRTSSVLQTPAFPKSVFAAGTAKRTREMWKKKSALDEDEVDVEKSRNMSARRAGRGGKSF